MSASSTLFAAFTPSLPAAGDTTPTPEFPGAPASSSGDSFQNVMAQVSGSNSSTQSTSSTNHASHASHTPAKNDVKDQSDQTTVTDDDTSSDENSIDGKPVLHSRALPQWVARALPAKTGVSTPATTVALAKTAEEQGTEDTEILTRTHAHENSKKDDAKDPAAPAASTKLPDTNTAWDSVMAMIATAVTPRDPRKLAPLSGSGPASDGPAPVDPKASQAQNPATQVAGTAEERVQLLTDSSRALTTGLTQAGAAAPEAKSVPPAAGRESTEKKAKVEDSNGAKTSLASGLNPAHVPVQPVDGTAGALKDSRMTFTGEKNEIAGGATQKVPTGSSREAVSASSAAAVTVTGELDRSASKVNVADAFDTLNTLGKAAEISSQTVSSAEASHSTDKAVTQAERLGQMVTQQVSMIRQSGSQHLAVSLKLDPNTELNLQLTNHNGQIEASLRWERGNIPGLESHWKDLQESLARQNVQLLPLESKQNGRDVVSQAGTTPGFSSSFQDAPRQSQQQTAGVEEDILPALARRSTTPATTKTSARPATRTSSQGWESYA